MLLEPPTAQQFPVLGQVTPSKLPRLGVVTMIQLLPA
jgi:hypothetical protein